MKKQLFKHLILLLVTALAFTACSNEDILVDIPDPRPTDGKMMVSITGTINDESPQTRSSFVYGEPLDDGGAAGEKFQWNAGDKINLRFSSQYDFFYLTNILSAPADLKAGQDATTFSGVINKYTGTQTIYAVSPAVQIGVSVSTLVHVNYPRTVIQKGKDLSHLGEIDYMWARVKDFDLGNDGENLKNAQLNFERLGAMLRFQIKNTSEIGKEYTLQSVTVSEENQTAAVLLYDAISFDLGDEKPVMKYISSYAFSRIIEVIGADALAKDETFDAYMMVPGSPAATDLAKVSGYRFVVKVVVTDENGEAYYREIKIDPGTNGEFINKGFAAGMRYYFVISVDEDNLVESSAVVNVETAGSLNTLIPNRDYISNLTVTGNIDMRDFVFMNSMPILRKLDLSGVTIDASDAYPAHTIPTRAFLDKSSLRYITLPDNLTAIGNEAFYYCRSLTGDLTIPAGVKTIGKNAFSSCSGLTGDLTIPASVTAIESFAFTRNNFSRVNLYWNTDAAILGYDNIWGLSYSVTKTVPNGMKALYEAKGWTNVVERDQ